MGRQHSRKVIKVTRGFITDFASVPRIFFFLPDWATYSKAPVLHDWLYQTKRIMDKSITRRQADKVFLEAMRVDWRHHRSRFFVARLEWLAVRLFGLWAWRHK